MKTANSIQLLIIVIAVTAILGLAACANIPVSGMTGGEALSVQLSVPATTTPDVSTDDPKLVNPIGLYFHENGQWGKRVEMVGGRYETEIGRTYVFTARALYSHELAKSYRVIEWRRGNQLLTRIPHLNTNVPDHRPFQYFTEAITWRPTHPSDPGVYATFTIQVEDEKGQRSNIAVLTPVVVVEPKVSPPAVTPAVR